MWMNDRVYSVWGCWFIYFFCNKNIEMSRFLIKYGMYLRKFNFFYFLF